MVESGPMRVGLRSSTPSIVEIPNVKVAAAVDDVPNLLGIVCSEVRAWSCWRVVVRACVHSSQRGLTYVLREERFHLLLELGKVVGVHRDDIRVARVE